VFDIDVHVRHRVDCVWRHAGKHIINEQTEMQTLCWGQWELNNQPVYEPPHACAHGGPAVDTALAGGRHWALEWMGIASPQQRAVLAAQVRAGAVHDGAWCARAIVRAYVTLLVRNLVGLYNNTPHLVRGAGADAYTGDEDNGFTSASAQLRVLFRCINC
jgi:hypothetical protein